MSSNCRGGGGDGDGAGGGSEGGGGGGARAEEGAGAGVSSECGARTRAGLIDGGGGIDSMMCSWGTRFIVVVVITVVISVPAPVIAGGHEYWLSQV